MFREEATDHGIVLHGAHHPPPFHGQIDHRGEHPVAGAGDGRLCGHAVQRSFELRELHFDGGADDLVLGLELVVDRRLRDADRVGDHLERSAVHPACGEQIERRMDGAGLGRAARDGPQSGHGRRLGETHGERI